MVHLKGNTMFKICLSILIIALSSIYADTNKSFINIFSNVENTTVLLNGKDIGMAPILQYEVTPNENISIKGMVDKDYYLNDIEKKVQVRTNNIETVNLKFEKAKGKLFLVGDDADIYINDKYLKKLNDSNRMIEVEAGSEIKLNFEEGYARNEYNIDVKANSVTTFQYELILIPKAVRLYTSSIYELMWEDTKEATNTDINWDKAKAYCENLTIAHYDDFRLPDMDELDELYDNQEEIYNGFGGKFYWSDSEFENNSGIWSYSMGKNFEDGTHHKSVKEFRKGRVRCVRDIINEEGQ